MAYRNKTYVCFDGDNDIRYYRLMQAWKQNDNTNFDMFIADVSLLNDEEIGMCIINISDKHILHPNNKGENIEIIFNDCKFVVSGKVKLYTYYTDGLINSFGNEEPEYISNEELNNILENKK